MRVMNGIELRKQINENENLRKKNIPFIYYTTSATEHAVKEAYEMSVQGFFVKEHDIKQIGALIHEIYTYWHWCQHPNK
jgi:CheY-like chemotaxis protein